MVGRANNRSMEIYLCMETWRESVTENELHMCAHIVKQDKEMNNRTYFSTIASLILLWDEHRNDVFRYHLILLIFF